MGSDVEEAGRIDKALAKMVVAKMVFSKETEVQGSWWTSDWGGSGPKEEETDDVEVPCLGCLMGLGAAKRGTQPAPSGCGRAWRSFLRYDACF